MNLSELKTGDIAIIDSFTNQEISIRMLEMGILPGEKVKIINTNSFGGLIVIDLYGSRLILPNNDAKSIKVK